MSLPEPLDLGAGRALMVLTGAGVSAESGLSTFRGGGGLWEDHPVEQVASPEGFARDPALVWRFYSERRRGAAGARPNAGHIALARIEERLGDRFLLATQNVDGLHAAAGSRRLLEMHGSLFRTRCSGCDRPPFADCAAYDGPPLCDLCGGLLRPDIVWFGESLDPACLDLIERFMIRSAAAGGFVFLAAGTSGSVWPAAGCVEAAGSLGARTVLVNAEPPVNLHSFDEFHQGASGSILPALLGTG